MVKNMYRWKSMPTYTDEWITFIWRNLVWLITCLNKIFKKRNNNKLMRYRRKKQTKKLWSVLSCWKEWDVHREEKMRKVNIHKIHRITEYRIYRMWFWISEMLQKFIIVYLYHVGGVLQFPFKGKCGWRLNIIWYWRPHLWANKGKGTFSWGRVNSR